jgi:uncharacterized damage-inducible protein DinB
MAESVLVRLFEHNNWANLQIIQACSALSEEQLDAEPQTVTKGSIRQTLWHIMEAQEGYRSQLIGKEHRVNWDSPSAFAELQQAASFSGDGLLDLARGEDSESLKSKFHKDGYSIEPWVVMVQAINHATEHREQIKSMLSSLGVTPPRIDGWEYGRATDALSPISA